MRIDMLKSKIHNATVTGADLKYVGSISLDPELYKAAGLREFEKVDVLNINNGARLTTYVINGGAGVVCLNGAAARLVQPGDRVIIVASAQFDEKEAETLRSHIVVVGENSEVIQKIS